MPTDTFINLPFEKKLRLYKSAKKYFGKTEFEHAKVSELVELMGIKRRTYYSYFSSLEDLYNYVFAYQNVDCRGLFEGANLVQGLRENGFSNTEFDTFESYYLSVICSEYGLRKLYEYINTCDPEERVVLNVLIAILKQYELGIMDKQQVKDEIDVLLNAHI